MALVSIQYTGIRRMIDREFGQAMGPDLAQQNLRLSFEQQADIDQCPAAVFELDDHRLIGCRLRAADTRATGRLVNRHLGR